jgi:beta-lactamase regulating signal transducer with metallopeptidase domain
VTGRRLVWLSVLAAVPIACLSTVAGCRSAGPCGWIGTHGGFWWPAAYVPPLLIVLATALAYTLRLALMTLRASRELARLPRVPVPPNLIRNAQSAGIDRIAYLRAGSPVAFCAGLLRPTVFVSEGAVAALSQPELLAVLHHEADHARRHEPARRAARNSAAEVLTFLPLVRWWSERQIARSELSADAVAERMVGRPALAGALLLMTAPAIPLAAFVGHAELRAQRLLGMKIDEPKPPRAMWAATFVYSWLALSLAGCLFEVVGALVP